jgi:YjbE family integral membrane protein
MAAVTTAEFWLRLLEIGFLNLLLSGDNAVVIALAVRALPRRQRLLGQIWGTVGAVVLRLLFVGIVSFLLRIPLLRLTGGALLVWIAVKLVQPTEESEGTTRHGTSFWEAVWIILVADVTMSLDNVLAIAAAARGDMLLVGLGIATSLPIVVGGSGLLASLMNRYAWIIWLGGGILGYVAGDMMLEDTVVSSRLGHLAHMLEYVVPIGLAIVLTVLGWWLAKRHRARDPRVVHHDAMVDRGRRPEPIKRRQS